MRLTTLVLHLIDSESGDAVTPQGEYTMVAMVDLHIISPSHNLEP